MKVLIYKAKNGFEGTAKIGLPSRKNRIKMLKKHMGILVEGEKSKAGIELYEELFTKAEEIVSNVKITHVESKTEFKSFFEMSEDSLCDDACEDIIQLIMNGEELGEE